MRKTYAEVDFGEQGGMQLFLAFGFGALNSIELDIRFMNTELTLRVSLRAFEP